MQLKSTICTLYDKPFVKKQINLIKYDRIIRFEFMFQYNIKIWCNNVKRWKAMHDHDIKESVLRLNGMFSYQIDMLRLHLPRELSCKNPSVLINHDCVTLLSWFIDFQSILKHIICNEKSLHVNWHHYLYPRSIK